MTYTNITGYQLRARPFRRQLSDTDWFQVDLKNHPVAPPANPCFQTSGLCRGEGELSASPGKQPGAVAGLSRPAVWLDVHKGRSMVQSSESSVLAADVLEPFLFGSSVADAIFGIFVSD